jgi:hypothetical protein
VAAQGEDQLDDGEHEHGADEDDEHGNSRHEDDTTAEAPQRVL